LCTAEDKPAPADVPTMSDREDEDGAPGRPDDEIRTDAEAGRDSDSDSDSRSPAPRRESAAGSTAGDGPVDVAEVADGETGTETETEMGTGTGFDAEAVLADEPLGEPRHIDGGVRYQWLVGSTFAAVGLAVLVTAIFQVTAGRVGVDPTGTLPLGISETTVLVAVLAFVAFEGLAGLRAVLLYRSWRYEIRADSLYLTRGVLTRVQTVAPYVRVQHIDTRRSPFERLLGLSSLVVYTAGSRGADVTVPGLTDERAAELQRRLKRLAIASEEADAV